MKSSSGGRTLCFALGTSLAITLVACAPTVEPAETPSIGAHVPAAPSKTPAPETPAQASGTRGNPVPVDTLTQYATTSMWSFSVGAPVADPWPAILAENQFNEPAAEGQSFVMSPVYVTIQADNVAAAEGANPWASLDFTYVTAAGNSFDTNSCGLIPNDLYDVGTMYPGAEARFNVCAKVPTEHVSGGAWRVGYAGASSDAVFIAGAP